MLHRMHHYTGSARGSDSDGARAQTDIFTPTLLHCNQPAICSCYTQSCFQGSRTLSYLCPPLLYRLHVRMMYSATLLASLLASAHGFASIPEAGSGEAPEVECSANEEKFFVYSIDPSLGYKFVQDLDADKYTDPAVDYSLVAHSV